MVLPSFFYIDRLSYIMAALVVFLGLTIAFFSRKYMMGDRRYKAFLVNLILVCFSVLAMVCADHLIVLFLAWLSSNFFLVRLMIHKPEWPAAKASGRLAGTTFIWGSLAIALGLGALYASTGETSIHALIQRHSIDFLGDFGLVCLFIGAMTQSALWPFHRWLLSSLNSPTPVSALMHAGLVNAGGFLMVRFAPLYCSVSNLLTVVFCLGVLTAFLGNIWKLMQNDVKRMLACSTMGQMGFMMMQVGLGLFPLAIAHLCWHSMFKSYLFLSSGSAAQEKRLASNPPPQGRVFLLALVCGLSSALIFNACLHGQMMHSNTTLFLMCLAAITGTQFALTILREARLSLFLWALFSTSLLGEVYGLSILGINHLLAPLNLMHPQPLNWIHGLALLLFICPWLWMVFLKKNKNPGKGFKAFYVWNLNASQPHPKTTTPSHTQYKF